MKRAELFVVLLLSGCHSPGANPAAPDASETHASEARAEGGAAGRSADDEYWAHTKTIYRVPIEKSPVLGPPSALVTIVEFSELQCDSCAEMENVLRAVRTKYGERVRIIWKDKPLGRQPAAEPAAEAAREVRTHGGDGAFWAAHDRLVAERARLMGDTGPDLDAIATTASGGGVSAAAVRKAIATQAHREEIARDGDVAEDFEVEGIPTFFFNGRRLEGVQPQAKIERMVDEEIARAEGILATGTPPEKLYDALVAGGFGAWAPQMKPLVPFPAGDPTLGDARAKVSVHVFSDYQCALCAAVERAVTDLRKEYGAKIRFVWHDLPLARHRQARLFAQAGREALAQKGAPAFWEMHDAIALAPHVPEAADLDSFATRLHLDAGKWHAGLADGAHAHELDLDADAAKAEGITETPSFLVAADGATEAAFVGNIEYASKLHRVVETAFESAEGNRERDVEPDRE